MSTRYDVINFQFWSYSATASLGAWWYKESVKLKGSPCPSQQRRLIYIYAPHEYIINIYNIYSLAGFRGKPLVRMGFINHERANFCGHFGFLNLILRIFFTGNVKIKMPLGGSETVENSTKNNHARWFVC